MNDYKMSLRNIYRVLASQSDQLGFIVHFTTSAKVIIQDIWKQDFGSDDQIEQVRKHSFQWAG